MNGEPESLVYPRIELRDQTKNRSKVKTSGQECPLHTNGGTIPC
jgi:hypothetical protein